MTRARCNRNRGTLLLPRRSTRRRLRQQLLPSKLFTFTTTKANQKWLAFCFLSLCSQSLIGKVFRGILVVVFQLCQLAVIGQVQRMRVLPISVGYLVQAADYILIAHFDSTLPAAVNNLREQG